MGYTMLLGLGLLLCAATLSAAVEFKQVCGRGPFGGGGGGAFTDAPFAGGRIRRVDIRSGRLIDGIQITYGDVTAPYHGGGGGGASFFNVPDGNWIVEVEGRSGAKIDQLIFKDNEGNSYGTFGGTEGSLFFATGSELEYIEGRSGEALDQITFYFTEC